MFKKVKNKTLQKILRFTVKFAMWFVIVSILWVLLYKWVNPPTTMLMLSRSMGSDKKIERKWKDIDQISRQMQLAVIVGEDQNYNKHYGFDFSAIQRAMEHNRTHRNRQGASTISQQTAKNVFLWESRSWIRKGLEAWFTLLIETFWSKKRIMEVYLNVIEMGDMTFGAEAAAKKYYGVSAKQLGAYQAAQIAGLLPCPRTCGLKSAFTNARTSAILYGMKQYGIQLEYLNNGNH